MQDQRQVKVNNILWNIDWQSNKKQYTQHDIDRYCIDILDGLMNPIQYMNIKIDSDSKPITY